MAKSRGRSPQLTDFAALPRCFYKTPEYRSLSLGAKALLVEFALSYTGRNNGNLEMTADQAHEAGIGSHQTFQKYKTELINAGWIVVTRQGGLGNRCNLYALTYLPIDDTGRRYDHPYMPSPAPLHLWKAANAEQRDARRKPSSRRRVEKLHGKEAVAPRID